MRSVRYGSELSTMPYSSELQNGDIHIYIRACVCYSQTAQVDVQKITDIRSAFDDQWVAAGVGATEGKRSSHGVKAVLQLVGRSRSPCLLGLLFLR